MNNHCYEAENFRARGSKTEGQFINCAYFHVFPHLSNFPTFLHRPIVVWSMRACFTPMCELGILCTMLCFLFAWYQFVFLLDENDWTCIWSYPHSFFVPLCVEWISTMWTFMRACYAEIFCFLSYRSFYALFWHYYQFGDRFDDTFPNLLILLFTRSTAWANFWWLIFTYVFFVWWWYRCHSLSWLTDGVIYISLNSCDLNKFELIHLTVLARSLNSLGFIYFDFVTWFWQELLNTLFSSLN